MSSKSETTPVWQGVGHVPAPVEHRGADRTQYVEDHGIRYLINPDEPEAWLLYDGCVSEVVL